VEKAAKERVPNEALVVIGERIAWLCSHVLRCMHKTLRQYELSDDHLDHEGALNGSYSYNDWYWDKRPKEERPNKGLAPDTKANMAGARGCELQMPYVE